MASDGTVIPGFTFNPWIGCAKVSPGCASCYASVDTFARRSRANGLELWGVDAARHVTSDAYWRQPAKWNRQAERDGVRRRVFCGSLCDVFEDRPDLHEARARLAGLIAATPSLDWLLLTKRPQNAARLWREAVRRLEGADPDQSWDGRLPPNVWLGTTAEDQKRADERIPQLLAVPAAVHFVSYEPALGAVDFTQWLRPAGMVDPFGRWIDWLIVGGESGTHARPFDLAWARSAVAQCRGAWVACFVKQLGARPADLDKMEPTGRMRIIDGRRQMEMRGPPLGLLHRSGADPSEWPEDLRVRQFPRGTP